MERLFGLYVANFHLDYWVVFFVLRGQNSKVSLVLLNFILNLGFLQLLDYALELQAFIADFHRYYRKVWMFRHGEPYR